MRRPDMNATPEEAGKEARRDTSHSWGTEYLVCDLVVHKGRIRSSGA